MNDITLPEDWDMHVDSLNGAEYPLTRGYKLYMWHGHGDFLNYILQRDDAADALFSGDEFKPSSMQDSLGHDAAIALLGFLTLKPGDTDAEYFDGYTPAQLEFAEGEAEYCGFEWEELLNERKQSEELARFHEEYKGQIPAYTKRKSTRKGEAWEIYTLKAHSLSDDSYDLFRELRSILHGEFRKGNRMPLLDVGEDNRLDWASFEVRVWE